MNGRTAGMMLLALAAGCATQQPYGENSGDERIHAVRDVEPLAVLQLETYAAGLLTVDVTLAEGSLPFLVDSGGGVTLVTPDVAEGIGCTPFGRGVGFRHDGEQVEFARCPPTRLQIGDWRRPARELAVWDLMTLVPEGLPTLGGLVSLDSFDGLPVTFDLGNEQVVVESPESLARRIESGTEIPLRAAHQAAGASLDVFLAIEAEPGPLWFELDSGNAGPVRIAPHAAAMLGLELSESEARPVALSLPGYGTANVQAIEKEMIYDGLLNVDFLREHTVTLDLAEDRAWIAR